jgi:hypothetical protein
MKLRDLVSMSSINVVATGIETWDDYAQVFKANFEEFKSAFGTLQHCFGKMLPATFTLTAAAIPNSIVQNLMSIATDHIKKFELFYSPYSGNPTHFKDILIRSEVSNSYTEFLDEIFIRHHEGLSACLNDIAWFQSMCDKVLSLDDYKLQKELVSCAMVTFSTVSILGFKYLMQVEVCLETLPKAHQW